MLLPFNPPPHPTTHTHTQKKDQISLLTPKPINRETEILTKPGKINSEMYSGMSHSTFTLDLARR
jgi:hypothetical protein